MLTVSPPELTGPAAGVPRIDFADFLARLNPGAPAGWKQGEHVSLVGPTGCGKTTMELHLLPLRNYVVAFGTKPKDSTMSRLLRTPYVGTDGVRRRGWKRLEKWPPLYTDERVILWPKIKTMGERREVLRDRFVTALAAIFEQAGWCVCFDELRYICQTLGLGSVVVELWTLGRAVGISVVGGTQRPAFVPLEMFDQATHLMFWRDNDEANLKRIGGIGSLSAKEIRAIVASLPKHDALYINTRTGEMLVTRAERI